MQVTLLYVDGCPNWRIADERLVEALARLGRSDVTVIRRQVASDADAGALGFHGSPTILVDGQDLFAEAAAPAGLSCRMYRNVEGRSGAPTVDQLLEALAAGMPSGPSERPEVSRAPLGRAWAGEQGSSLARYLLLVVAVAAVALAGYSGYVLYPRFDLPSVEGAAVLGLAATAGVASFFSPCSFPLLLGILGRHATARARGAERAARPAFFAGALAVGAGAFLLLAGLIIAAGGGVLFEQVTFDSPAGITIRSVVGVLLVLLGLVQVGVIRTPFHAVERAAQPMLRRQAQLRREHPIGGYALFGFGYVLAGFG